MICHKRQKIFGAEKLLKVVGEVGVGDGEKGVKDGGDGGAKQRKKTRDPNKAKRKYTFKQGKPGNPRKSGFGRDEVKAESK